MAPMARDREKNICPPAAARTLIKPRKLENGSKLGANMNFKPSAAPSSVTDRPMMISSMTNSAGMPTLLNFSMPSETPPRTTRMFIRTKISVKMMQPKGLVIMARKESAPVMADLE